MPFPFLSSKKSIMILLLDITTNLGSSSAESKSSVPSDLYKRSASVKIWSELYVFHWYTSFTRDQHNSWSELQVYGIPAVYPNLVSPWWNEPDMIFLIKKIGPGWLSTSSLHEVFKEAKTMQLWKIVWPNFSCLCNSYMTFCINALHVL